MMANIKSILNKFISFCLVIGFILAFFITYVLSMVVVEPRDVTKIFRFINEKFVTNDVFEIKSESIILSWNKESFSFDFNFMQNEILYKDNKIEIPHLIADISKSHLFLGSFKIEKLKIYKIDYFVDGFLFKAGNKKISFDSEIYKKLENIDYSVLSNIKSVEIGNIHFKDDQGQEIYRVSDIRYDFARKIFKNEIEAGFIFEAEDISQFYLNCDLQKNNSLRECNIGILDVTSNNARFLMPLNNQLDFDFDVEFSIRKNIANYKIYIESFIRDLAFYKNAKFTEYQDIELFGDANIDKNSLQLEKLVLKQDKGIIEASTKYIKKEKKLGIDIRGEKIVRDEIFLLWPEFASPATRNWLEGSIENAYIDYFDFRSEFNLKNEKPKANFILGNFNFYDTDFKFSSQVRAIKNASGLVKLINKELEVEIDEAYIEKEKISDFYAYIPELKRGGGEINISGDLKIKVTNLIRFLLLNKLKESDIKFIEHFAGDDQIDGRLAIDVLLAKPFSDKNLKITFLGNSIPKSQIFSENSNIKLSLNKNFADHRYFINLDLKESQISFPIVKYNKDSGKLLDLNLIASPSINRIKFHDVSLIGEKENINAEILFSNSGLISAIVRAWQLGDNIFTLDAIKKGEALDVKFNAERIAYNSFFDKISLPKVVSNKEVNLDFLIRDFAISKNHNISNIIGRVFSKKGRRLAYFNGEFLKEDNISMKFSKSIEAEELILETSNLGYLLSALNIFDGITDGNINLVATKTERGYKGEAKFSNLYIARQRNEFLKKVSELKIYKNKNLAEENNIYFTKGVTDFIVNKEVLEIEDAVLFQRFFALTANGKIKLQDKDIKIKGLVVPVHNINNLFGIADIPLIGRLLTGGKDRGIVSVDYKLAGKANDMKIEFSPLTVFIPNFLKRIIDSFPTLGDSKEEN